MRATRETMEGLRAWVRKHIDNPWLELTASGMASGKYGEETKRRGRRLQRLIAEARKEGKGEGR